MSYQSLYRRYRPSKIDDVVAQEHIMEVLIKSIKKDKISHAYLFCGPRGTGKTSIAKLFAKAINCTSQDMIACGVCENCIQANHNNHPDLIEIDAASNNGVDEIRSLIEKVKYTPIQGKYKVYIIDEVHMLSQGAFNALLKTLEEPPQHVVFILATTEIHKVLPTIISRCQRFDFSRIPNDAIEKRLDFILTQEKVEAENGVTKTIASLSGGGLRNALTILEQAIVLAEEKITVEQIYESNGMITPADKIELFASFLNGQLEVLMANVKNMLAHSVQFDKLINDLVTNIKDSIILTHTGQANLVDYNNFEFIKYLSKSFEIPERLEMITIFLNYLEKMRFSQQPEMYFDVAILEIFSKSSKLDRSNDETKDNQPKQHSNDKLKTLTELVENVGDNKKNIQTVVDDNTEDSFDYEEEYRPDEPIGFDFEVDMRDESIHDQETEAAKELDVDTLLRLMVTADKETRKTDELEYSKKDRYRYETEWARAARLLGDGKLVLSGDYFVVISMSNPIEVRELSEDRNKEALLRFSKKLFGTEKIILSTTNELFKNAVETFVKLQKSGVLPKPISKSELIVEQPDLLSKPKDETLSKVQDLFGDSIQIIE